MNIIKTAIPIGLMIMAVSVLLPVNAQEPEIPVRGPIPFNSYDLDNDGFISETEFSVVREERISARSSEGRPMRGAANAPAFEMFDSDGDGLLTREELTNGQEAMMGKRRGMGMGMNQGAGRGMNGGMNKGMNMPSYSDYDLNGDGTIPEAEFNAAREKRISARKAQGYQMRNLDNMPTFTSIDTNNDGEISAGEFLVHQQQQRQW